MRVHKAASAALAVMIAATGLVLVAAPAGADRPTAKIDFEDYDQATVDALMLQGFDEGEALFIALTKVESKTISDDHVRMTSSFPTGNKAVVDIRIAPIAADDPDALKLKHDSAGGEFEFTFGYFVPADAIPVEAQPTVALAGSAPGATVSLASFSAAVPTGDKPSGFQVLVQGLVDSIRGEQGDNFLKEMDKKLKTPKLDRLNNGMKVAQTVGDVMAMGIDLAELERELDEIEKCAKNPADPLQRKANKENPGDLQRLLGEIAATRAELRGNTAVSVVGTINSTASGFIQGAPGWLGHVIGPGTSWAIDTLKKVAQDRMNELRKQAKCKNDLKIDKVLKDLWHITGIKCGGPTGVWELDGVLTNSPPATGNQHITFTLPGGSLSGSFTATGDITVHTPVGDLVTPYNNSGSVSFTRGADDTGGTLNFGGENIPAQAGKFCHEAAA